MLSNWMTDGRASKFQVFNLCHLCENIIDLRMFTVCNLSKE